MSILFPSESGKIHYPLSITIRPFAFAGDHSVPDKTGTEHRHKSGTQQEMYAECRIMQ